MKRFAVYAIAVCMLSVPPGATAKSATPAMPVAPAGPASTSYRVVGYYGDWDKYCHPGDCAPISHVQFNHISDLIYAFGDETNDRCKLADGVNDSAKDFPTIRAMKHKYPNLRVLLSIGGASYSPKFPAAVSTAADIKKLVANCMTRIHKTYKGVFDGIDIDWEFPHNATQRTNFTKLISAFRAGLGKTAPLTIAAGSNPSDMTWIDWVSVAPKLSWVNLMTYDYHGPWGDPDTDFLSPLKGDANDPQHPAKLWASHSIAVLHNTYRVPLNKILLGIPAYGLGYAGVPSTNNGLYQPYTGKPSFGTTEAGSFDYKDLVANYINKNGYTAYGPDAQSTESWVYSPTAHTFISYDTPASIAQKSTYIKASGLGGAMVWDVAFDTSDPSTSLTTALFTDLSPIHSQ